MHPQQRLARRTECISKVQLGHHHALEQVGGFPDNDGVDVGEPEPGIGERAVDRLPAQPGDRHIRALASMVRLAGAEHRRSLAC